MKRHGKISSVLDTPSAGRQASTRAVVPILALAALFLAASCSMSEADPSLAPKEDEPDATFIGFSREEVQDGVVTFSAKAERAEYFQDAGLLVIYNITFEDRGAEGGSAEATGLADKAIYHEDTGDAEFSGFVQIYSPGEDTYFETSALNYFSASRTIEGLPDNLVIVKVGKKLFIQGAGFFADIQQKAFAFRDGARGVYSVESASIP
ncbi:MAG TPA: LPS export ABC transporter periplasmic protein LptC [Rectinemataceae bacterium]|nr:LPS export ABC transporter periplasmic protein LptC [Rectinemataceae bacterium]